MDNIYLIALVVSLLYLLCKFIEMRFIIKENKPIKSIIIDSIFIYFCVIIAFFLSDQFNSKTKSLTEAPVFVDNPKF
jgi:hypothetical protein